MWSLNDESKSEVDDKNNKSIQKKTKQIKKRKKKDMKMNNIINFSTIRYKLTA